MVDMRPSDMKPLSDAPKVVRMVRKVKQEEEDEFDMEKVKNRVRNFISLHCIVHKLIILCL